MNCEEIKLLAEEASTDNSAAENMVRYLKILRGQMPDLETNQINLLFEQALLIIKSEAQQDIKNILNIVKKNPNKEIRICLRKIATEKQQTLLENK